MHQTPTTFSEHYYRKCTITSAITPGLSKDDARPLSRWKNDAVDVYINKVDQYTHLQCMLVPQHNKIHTPSNPTAIPGIVPAIALNTNLVKPDAEDLSGLSSAQD